MELAMPVLHPRCTGTTLLRAGVRLDVHAVKRLRELDVRDLWIRFPSLDFLSQYVGPEIHEACAELASAVGPAFDATMKGAGVTIDFYLFKRCVSQLLERILSVPCAAMLVDAPAGIDDPPLRHSASVCFISLLLGLKLDFYLVRERARMSGFTARDVSNLGVGALLHDLGMLRLTPDVRRRWDEKADESDPAWREHVTLGYRMVRDEIDPSAAAVVLHHHQRYDGSGFPRRPVLSGDPAPVAGSDIHVFARIAAVADAFDQLRYGDGIPPSDDSEPRTTARRSTAEVLRLVKERAAAGGLDPTVVQAMIAILPPFAPGSQVGLSDGRHAVVTAWSADDPLRPTVQIVKDLAEDARSEKPGERLDLRITPGVRIVEADGFNVSGETNPHQKVAA